MKVHLASDYWLDISWGEDAIESQHPHGICEKAEAESSGGNKPVSISSWAAFAMGWCQDFMGRMWISRHHLFKSHFQWVLFFRFSILSVSFKNNAILSKTLWISIMKKNIPLANVGGCPQGVFQVGTVTSKLFATPQAIKSVPSKDILWL